MLILVMIMILIVVERLKLVGLNGGDDRVDSAWEFRSEIVRQF